MNKRFEQGLDEIAKLCRYFSTNSAIFSGSAINEAQVRQALIDPFFEALGWDVRNTLLVAPQYREVIPEDSLDIGGQRKAPDYAFRVGQTPKFYVEAKRCSVNVKEDASPAYQLRRYGWSAKVPLSLLTDFEELAIYDCLQRPQPVEKAGHARIQFYRFDQYPDCWREIWDIFSREAVWAGSFDQYAASKRKRGTSEVDVEFLKEIEAWRNDLARNIALRNGDLSTEELNTAVQRIIDRIVFLRMAEDRGLEPFEQLLHLCNEPNVYARFTKDLCRRADDKYNSGIFHFQRESGIDEAPDTITPQLVIDDKVFKPILQRLYWEHGSPYDFGVLPVEILGTVYERFLGKVIRLTPGHQAKVEEKPEVRKAGGVYYTPAYIVDYIVNHTVGERIAGKSPAQLAGDKNHPPLRILDMACGSGSFLLGAYQKLLNHCLDWYQNHEPETHGKAVFQSPRNGQWQLTIAEKKRLLTTHLFGVDIDDQAVEVTKLSLLLKALEGENDASLASQLQLFQERALPNLARNIQCGNSLIGPDYFTADLLPNAEDIKRINPFDWNTAFPEAMQQGGFDCIIGNPPYVRQENLGELKPYFESHYTVYQGTADLYVYFFERANQLLFSGGHFGMICSNKFMRAKYGKALRDFLVKNVTLRQIVDFGELPVFQGAATFPAVFLTQKGTTTEQQFLYAPIKHLNFGSLKDEVEQTNTTLDARSLLGQNWTLARSEEVGIFQQMLVVGIPLGEYVSGQIFYGIKTGFNEAFVIDSQTREELINADPNSERIIKPFVVGDDIRRYHIRSGERFLIFARRGIDIRHYPAIEEHLRKYKTKLTPRPKDWKGDKWAGRKPGAYKWYEIQDTVDYFEEFEKPKIIYPDIAKESRIAYSEGPLHFGNTVYFIPGGSKYLLGILNSRLVFAFFKRIASVLGDADKGGRLRWFRQDVVKIPIRVLDMNNPSDKALHNRMTSLVDVMLSLSKQLQSTISEQQKVLIQYQITRTDAEIDQIVYELYALTDREMRFING